MTIIKNKHGRPVLIFLMLVLVSCDDEKTDSASVPRFERPQDVALVCYDTDQNRPLPIDCCSNEVNLENGSCDFGVTMAKLYAFVTQTTPGEVAVVDMEAQKIVAPEESVEVGSFIPVGDQPNDIAATDDGTRLYTTNRESGDVSVIRTISEDGKSSVIEQPYLSPAATIDLDGSAGRMVLVKHPEEYKDRVAIVTQPEMGRLAVLALDKDDCPDPKKQKAGCVKGYLPLAVAGRDEMVSPYAMADGDGEILYVGSYDTPALFEIQLASLVEAAMQLDDPAELSQDDVPYAVMDISPYQTRSLSIDPADRRWLYGIDAVEGAVIAMDLGAREPLSGDPLSIQRATGPGGLVRAVKLLDLEETGDAGPFTFNGTFAIVATTGGDIAVIDIEDDDQDSIYFKPHRMRSIVDLTDEVEGVPKMKRDPVLSVDGYAVQENTEDYVQLVEADAGVGCDGGDPFKAEYDRGVRFRCDPYMSRKQTWTLTWEGTIGLSGVGIVTNIVDKETDEPWRLLREDRDKNLCATEIYTEGAVEGYPGDRLIITSEPTPVDGEEDLCDELYEGLTEASLQYRIVGVSKYSETDEYPNVIEFEKLDEEGRDLLPECFGQALRFEVRASEHWIIKGSSSSYTVDTGGTFVEEEKKCVYDTAAASQLRVYAGETYENQYIVLKMQYGDAWQTGPSHINGSETDTDTRVTATLAFDVTNGYQQMDQSIGATNITDIEVSPKNELIFVDQGGEGLVVFDLLDTFDTVGRHIY